MGVSDDEIDGLFQLPLAEFTKARDALVKRAGADGAALRALQKPSAAAWGVNQLFWRRRKSFDRLVAAFEKVRVAHASLLSGKAADRVRAEERHREALDSAVDDVRVLLREAGDPASGQTMAAVLETLQVVPAAPFSGRLSRPLAPIGFGALAALMGEAATVPARTADVVSIESGRGRPSRADVAREEAAQQRAEAERRARAEQAQRAVDEARAVEGEAHSRAAAAEAAGRRADDAVARARAALQDAEAEARRLATEAKVLVDAARAARDVRVRCERELQQIRSS